MIMLNWIVWNRTVFDIETALRQLHKNATSYIEQILVATSHKTEPVRPPASYH